jgi:hypothetical protein
LGLDGDAPQRRVDGKETCRVEIMDQQQMACQLFRNRHDAGEPRRRKDKREEQ